MKVSVGYVDQHRKVTFCPGCTVDLGFTERTGVNGSCPKEKREDDERPPLLPSPRFHLDLS